MKRIVSVVTFLSVLSCVAAATALAANGTAFQDLGTLFYPNEPASVSILGKGINASGEVGGLGDFDLGALRSFSLQRVAPGPRGRLPADHRRFHPDELRLRHQRQRVGGGL